MIKKLVQQQYLEIPIESAWAYFATPYNLNEVTPSDMHFEITSDVPDKMYAGLMIMYKLKPMLNMTINWCTEITFIEHGRYFVDEQRKGPYRLWHHEHHFEAKETGTLMTDILHYDIGRGIFGRLAGLLFVDKKVQQIFKFRYLSLEKRFNQKQ